MSTPMTGADLGHLDDLAAEYATAGADVAARAAELRTQIACRVGRPYRQAMDRLRADTERTTTAMGDEIADAGGDRRARSPGPAPTASRSTRSSERFAGEVRSGTAADRRGRARAARRRRRALRRAAGGVRPAIADAGDGIETAGGDLRTSVAAQREALHQAAERGRGAGRALSDARSPA